MILKKISSMKITHGAELTWKHAISGVMISWWFEIHFSQVSCGSSLFKNVLILDHMIKKIYTDYTSHDGRNLNVRPSTAVYSTCLPCWLDCKHCMLVWVFTVRQCEEIQILVFMLSATPGLYDT